MRNETHTGLQLTADKQLRTKTVLTAGCSQTLPKLFRIKKRNFTVRTFKS